MLEPIWEAGIYTRLSDDGDERKNESIDTQIEIAKEYISQAGDIELVDCYSDLGKTGTNFKRDGFERMMADIRRKRINCVIVKDLSRFGRNYIETGNYIEKIFPFLKVRFIAVTDGYDSEHISGDEIRLSMNLKNIVNELYAKDIAQRTKISKKLKQEMGSYTGGLPPYGYCVKDVGDKKVLYPDEATRDIVVLIFERYAQGTKKSEIVEELYQKRVQRPLVYQATKEVYCPQGGTLQQWSPATIKWMLANPVYIGTLFQARTCGKSYREHQRHEIGEEDITIVEHTHEAIIPEELFYKVAQRFEKQSIYSNKDGFSKKIPLIEDIWKDRVYCGECGHRLIRSSQIKTFSSGDRMRCYRYGCPNRRKNDQEACKCQGISLRKIEEIVKAALEKEFALSGKRPKDYCKRNLQEAEKRKEEIRKRKCQALERQEELVIAGSKNYLKYREGELSREEFLEEKKKMEEELEMVKGQAEDYKNKEDWIDREADAMNRFIRGLLRCKGNGGFDRELVECLVKRINVYEEQQVEIIWNYRKNDLLFQNRRVEGA